MTPDDARLPVMSGAPAPLTPTPSTRARWWELAHPFRHIVVEDLLDADRYTELSALFKDLRAGRVPGREFKRSTDTYDALMLAMDDAIAPLFAPFFDADWLSGIARLLGMPFLPMIDGALHSSPPGARTGWVHSDYCSAWFHKGRTSGELLFPDRTQLDYFTGRPKSQAAVPLRYIRGATLIYYLANDGWEPGDGGETELLAASREFAEGPVKYVAPLNNRLLIFPCSRHSFHRFVTNRRERNSLILWLHVTPSTAETLWGPPTH